MRSPPGSHSANAGIWQMGDQCTPLPQAAQNLGLMVHTGEVKGTPGDRKVVQAVPD